MNRQKTTFLNQWLRVLLIPLMGIALNAYSAGGDHHDDHEERGPYDEHSDNEEQKGPNGGKLLHDGDVELELAIFERGVPPEYRAWITHDGKPVNSAELTVTLSRLGGQQDVFTFSKQEEYWLGDGVVTEPHSFDVAVNLRLEGKNLQWQWESHEGRVEIAADMAKKVGIGSEVAGPGSIERHLQVYGRLTTPPDQKAHLRARFPGVVTAVRANLGDRVNKDDVLAVIESNESLQSYELRAPMAGVIQERLANVGETTNGSPLFTLINNETLWAELKVFPGQRRQVQPGQSVHIEHNNHTHESQITHITSLSGGAPFVLARVSLRNESNDMAPGDLVNGKIDVEKVDVPLTIDNRALQDFRDWKVVFIKVRDTYEFRPLELGRSDGRYTEVLDGLNAGDQYVVENSYLIKADIEKSGASHDH